MPYAHKVSSDEKVHLKDVDSSKHDKLTKDIADATTEKLGEELSDLQDLLFEAGTHSLLIVLQGMDTGGKDGTIRCLARYLNMQGCRVASFKQPSEEESKHDFLWRIHQQTPATGQCTIFNRSQYEDVLVVRVHNLLPKSVWKKRYDDINHFENNLYDANTIIVKFYLHISKGEQEQRLLDREKDVDKSWKLSVGDWKERELWSDYTEAYEDALRKCSTDCAPWYIVPADHKWFRNLAVVETLVETLKPFKKGWHEKLVELGKEQKKELAAFRAKKA
ncbi:MAG TPA: PPK2 family polyphosphate kinase [Fimbriimonadaceae bacterium]|jgi:PPK2 family polyphosphate:nucleotide phosphotransferase